MFSPLSGKARLWPRETHGFDYQYPVKRVEEDLCREEIEEADEEDLCMEQGCCQFEQTILGYTAQFTRAPPEGEETPLPPRNARHRTQPPPLHPRIKRFPSSQGVFWGQRRKPTEQPHASNAGLESNCAGYTWRSRRRPTLRWDRIGERERPRLGEETSSVCSNWIRRFPAAASNSPPPFSPASGRREERRRAGVKSICSGTAAPPAPVSLPAGLESPGVKGLAGGCEEARPRRGGRGSGAVPPRRSGSPSPLSWPLQTPPRNPQSLRVSVRRRGWLLGGGIGRRDPLAKLRRRRPLSFANPEAARLELQGEPGGLPASPLPRPTSLRSSREPLIGSPSFSFPFCKSVPRPHLKACFG
ncbi:uncharacterized protein LOC112543128 [Python bivittatus]|uniref:Uncharacterized protein LOC112543128 n=1 Tax=Python bivittatus TaxID=176946 RepID=A0A9F5IWX1_PYTBI|nr:uncharacterized protein LOC112543128 [Python bivittatus]